MKNKINRWYVKENEYKVLALISKGINNQSKIRRVSKIDSKQLYTITKDFKNMNLINTKKEGRLRRLFLTEQGKVMLNALAEINIIKNGYNQKL